MKELLITTFIIFALRSSETTLSTLQTMFIAQSNKIIAPIIGAIDTAMYIVALSLVIDSVKSNYWFLFVYAVAYAVGIYVGILIEKKLSLGDELIQAVISNEQKYIVNVLRKEYNLRVTVLDAQGIENEKRLVLFIVVNRKKVKSIKEYLKKDNIFATSMKVIV